MIGEWILRQIRKAEDRKHPQQSVKSMPFYNNAAISVYRISNGFVLVSESPHKMESTIVYCKDVSEIGDQIVTLHARSAMGVPSDVRIGANGPAYPMTNRHSAVP
jgi:hypothetical protein